jgi:hypothetical protein
LRTLAGLAPADKKPVKALELENTTLTRLLAERDVEVDLMRGLVVRHWRIAVKRRVRGWQNPS